MRKIILAIIGILAVAFVAFSLSELESIRATLLEANPLYLLAGALVQILCLMNSAATFSALYQIVGLEERRSQMFLMATAANFVNLITASAGIGGIAVFLDTARHRGTSTARVMVVGILYLLYEYASLFCLLLLGFIVLVRRSSLNPGEVIAAAFLVVVALVIAATLFLGYRASARLGKILAWLARQTNRLLRPFLHRDVLNPEQAHQFSGELAEGIATIRTSRRDLVWPFLFTLNNKALLLGVLACTFLALNTPFTAGTLVGGFSISTLFFYASPTPSGVGFVEGILPGALNALRVPLTQAVLITLVFRGMTVWFPFAVGAVCFRMLQRQPAAQTMQS